MDNKNIDSKDNSKTLAKTIIGLLVVLPLFYLSMVWAAKLGEITADKIRPYIVETFEMIALKRHKSF